MFQPNSRYYPLETAKTTTSDGRTVAYKKRRFLPDLAKTATLAEVTITGGDRLDNITARLLGDPEQFWRVCDANNELNPADLTNIPGRRIRIAIPEV